MNDALVPASNAPKGPALVPAGWPAGRSLAFEVPDLVVSTVTISCKVRPEAYAWLDQAAREVNQVWNYCNEVSYKGWHGRYGRKRKWVSAFDMNSLLAGCGEVFDRIGIDVAQTVAGEHATRRSQFKRSKLSWRKSGGSRRSLGWIPFKPNGIRFSLHGANGKRVTLKNDPQPVVPAWPKKEEGEEKKAYEARKEAFRPTREAAQRELLAWENRRVQQARTIKLSFCGKTIRLFNSEYLFKQFRLAKQGVGALRSGNFSQDSLGDWYLNIVVDKVEAQLAPNFGPESSIGMDPGQITAMTGSDGRQLRSRRYRDIEPRIQQAQKRGHKKNAKRLNRKAKRQRGDDRNKYCKGVVDDYARIWVGDLSPKKMARSKLKGQAKSIHDAAIGAAYNRLEVLGHRAGRVVEKVNESNSTRRCSSCQALTGPTGLDSCVVRRWECSECHTSHDRDRNSGENLRHTGESGWQNRPPGDCVKLPRQAIWRPFAGTR